MDQTISLRNSSDEEVYELYCNYMEWSEELEETLEKSIVKIREETQALVAWRENLLSESVQRIQKTEALIEQAEEWKKENLKEMKEGSELEWIHLKEDVKQAQDKETTLQKTIQEAKIRLTNKQALLTEETLKNQQLQSALNLKRGN
jgi:hypothetical protein